MGKSTRFQIKLSEDKHLPTLRLLIFSSGQDAHSTYYLLPIPHSPFPIPHYLLPIPYSLFPKSPHN
ncbi:MAG: hypothetical protein F6J94_31755 [Moorea sp. SIO1F2]|uniref:hypothetical protein n=1 Tax=Moorena sp. SIO1F2 TaxID=2607819 RepID=UPI0013B66BA3|nr:hypothetical protein [Moorena sp. SIO1F2]NET86278.1 hypothetical protein [Moorena sp. SIO1F2]